MTGLPWPHLLALPHPLQAARPRQGPPRTRPGYRRMRPARERTDPTAGQTADATPAVYRVNRFSGSTVPSATLDRYRLRLTAPGRRSR